MAARCSPARRATCCSTSPISSPICPPCSRSSPATSSPPAHRLALPHCKSRRRGSSLARPSKSRSKALAACTIRSSKDLRQMPDKPIVLITNAMHPDGEAILAPHVKMIVPPDARPETLREWAKDADGIIVRAKLPDDIVDHAPRLKGIVRHGVGLDFIPVAAATARGIAVANLPGSNTNAVAEYVISALMHLRRPLHRLDGSLRSDGWNAARPAADGFTELGTTMLGILGVGTIGRRIANVA